MNVFGWRARPRANEAGEAGPPATEPPASGSESSSTPADRVEGERSIPSINRTRSLQSRVSTFLAVGLMSALGLGFLAWYYTGAVTRNARAQSAAQDSSKTRAKGEMALPPLGRIDPPTPKAPTTAEQILGPPPELPDSAATAAWHQADALQQSPQRNAGVPSKSPGDLAFERRLSGAVFARQSNATSATAPSASPPPPNVGALPIVDAAPAARPSALSSLLQPSVMPAVQARILPTREFLLGKGAFIDCTLETAIDSTLPGMTTCITATDTFGEDGRIVLLERGTKLIGETRGQVQQGAARLFVLWTEARTPTGVVVPLASPGTDELGRSGLPGSVNRHFWDRFGAAILISVVNGAVQAAAQSSSSDGGTVIINPTTTTDVMTEVLKSTLAIAPTITKPQGDRIQILVARDLDFGSVYELRNVTAARSGGAP